MFTKEEIAAFQAAYFEAFKEHLNDEKVELRAKQLLSIYALLMRYEEAHPTLHPDSQ